MRRRADAPREAPKFLGHGSCDVFNRTCSLSGPAGEATSLGPIISTHIWKLYVAWTALSEHPEDLRGIGVTVTKLENTDACDPQSKLSFLPNTKPATEARKLNNQDDQSPIAKRAPTAFPLPPQSQLDPATLAELPSQIRRSVEADYRSMSRDTTPIPAPAFGLSPSKGKGKMKAPADVRHIAKQLAPLRSKLTSPTRADRFFGKREHALVTDAELIGLGIDVEWFRAVPPEDGRAHLAEQRKKQRDTFKVAGPSGGLFPNHVKGGTDRDSRSRSRSVSIAPWGASPVARWAPILALKKASTTDDLQALITKWLDSATTGPGEAATKSISDFLLSCLDQKGLGDCGLEKVSAVMKWWHHCCRLKFGPMPEASHADNNDGESEPPALWWQSFRIVKGNLDSVVRKRFGGSLSLK